MKSWFAVLCGITFAGMALAEAPDTTIRPSMRPVVLPAYAEVRPVARPLTQDEAPVAAIAAAPNAALVVASSVLDDIPGLSDTLPTHVARVSSSNLPEDIVASLQSDVFSGPLAIIAPGGPDDPDFRPAVRPDTLAPLPPAQPTAAMRPSQRPYERPALAHGVQTLPLYRAEQNLFAFSPNAIAQSLRPEVRPAAFVREAEERAATIQRGSICGDAAIQGDALGNVPGPGQCGVENAVRVRSIAGVALTSRAVMDCRTATALKSWIVNGAKPAVGSEGGGIASLRVIGTYSCRNRNGASNGRISEHAFGHAIDIAGVGLQSGREITVLTDWNTQGDGGRLRAMWRAACGVFGTVLGPNANRFHRDHFHFDTARYRSGSYCR